MTAAIAPVRIDTWDDEHRIDDERAAWLQRGLVEAMPDLRVADLLVLRPGLLTESQHLVVASDPHSDLPLAVLGSSWKLTGAGRRFLHVGVQFVSPQLRGTDVFRRSWLEHMRIVISHGQFPTLSCLKTYNPVAYCAMRDFGRLPGAVMYPDVTGDGRSDGDGLRDCAVTIAAVVASDHDFDAETGIIRGVGQPRNLYRQRPLSREQDVNSYFGRHVAEGDRLLCVVEVRSRDTEAAIMQHFRTQRQHPSQPPPR